jgi:phage-related minor tail protein
MAVTVASLEAVLSLDKSKFDKGLKATDKGLDKTEDNLKTFAKQSDRVGDALAEATRKGRLGLGDIDRGAANAKGTLSSMMSAVSGGAAAAAESSLNTVSDGIENVGSAADQTRAKFGKMGGALSSRMDKAGKSVKDFGKDTDRTMKEFIDDMRKAADEVDALADAGDNASGSFAGMGGSISGMIPGLDSLASMATPAGALGLLATGAVAVGSAIVSSGLEAQKTMNLIQARTGATGAELKELGRDARIVFISGFGDSAEDATDAIIQTKQVLGQTGNEAIITASKALIMRDVFGVDIPESLRAVRSANKQFGDETATTFDMMATLIQRVGDPSQDLADTINEYSADFAQAGFSQAEFFGILESGVSEGARNFDVLADAVREFTIRIIDGSATTETALNKLFATTGRGGQEYFALQAEIDKTTLSIQENAAAVEESQGAFEAQASVVGDLENQLSDARRVLDELSRPNLQGMEEFDDKMFDLDQQAKRLQLALLDLDEEAPAFEQTKQALDDVNTEMDRIALERDLTIGAQLREIEKAATAGLEPVVSYEQALADVAAQQEDIKGLESALVSQQEALEPLANEYNRLVDEGNALVGVQKTLQTQLEEMVTPANEFIEAISTGAISQRDAMSQVLQMLSQVEDQVVADQLAVDLFGSKGEELGVDILLALDPAVNKMTEFEGATLAAGDAINQGLGPALTRLGRTIKTGIGIIGEFVVEGDFAGLADAIISGDVLAATPDSDVPTMQAGGVVPGLPGQAVPIIAHAGETVIPQGQQAGGGVTVIIQGSINGDAHLKQVVNESFDMLNMALAGGA